MKAKQRYTNGLDKLAFAESQVLYLVQYSYIVNYSYNENCQGHSTKAVEKLCVISAHGIIA